jgi:hypothetical protein
MLKWFPALATLCAYGLSLAVYQQLPGAVPLDFGRLLPMSAGQPDLVPKAVAAFGLPSLALLLFLLLYEAPTSALGRAAARLFPARDASGSTRPVEYHKFAPSYRLIVGWVVMLVISMHLALLSSTLGWFGEPGTIVGIVFGVGMLIAGNVMPRLRPNPVAGVRTARTMADPQHWARVHRAYGAFWVVAGIVVVGVAIAAPRYALVTGLAALLLSSLAVLATPRLAPAAIILAGLAVPISVDAQEWDPKSSAAAVVVDVEPSRDTTLTDAGRRGSGCHRGRTP